LKSWSVSVTVQFCWESANANLGKGTLSDSQQNWTVTDTDQLFKAYEYQPLIVAGHVGAPVRLRDVAEVLDSVEDTRNLGLYGGKPAVLLAVFRQPGANMIETVDRIMALFPQLRASISPSLHLNVAVDRTTTIRASVHDVEVALIISIILVISWYSPSCEMSGPPSFPASPFLSSLIGTFGVMYLCHYSLDNLSLMALTISTGFVRGRCHRRHREHNSPHGKRHEAVRATMKGASEIGFTVLSMSTSLVAVFIPILLMGGIVGRLFREFAVVLSVAIGVSLLISLTTTPMMCARFLRHETGRHNRVYRFSENIFNRLLRTYDFSLRWVLRHQFLILLLTFAPFASTSISLSRLPRAFSRSRTPAASAE